MVANLEKAYLKEQVALYEADVKALAERVVELEKAIKGDTSDLANHILDVRQVLETGGMYTYSMETGDETTGDEKLTTNHKVKMDKFNPYGVVRMGDVFNINGFYRKVIKVFSTPDDKFGKFVAVPLDADKYPKELYKGVTDLLFNKGKQDTTNETKEVTQGESN